MPTEPKFRDLTSDENQFVESSIRLGREVCDHYLSDAAPTSPDLLDDVYEAWASDAESEKPTPEEVCYGLGALLGNFVVSDLGFSWGMAIDEFGTDYSVRHPDAWQSFPFDFVAKRIQDQEPQGGFFRALYDQLELRNPG
jgi:hypothetical protein